MTVELKRRFFVVCAAAIVVIATARVPGQTTSADNGELRADKTNIRFGESLILSWTLPARATTTYLTGVGLLAGSGTTRVSPSETTTYVMVSDASDDVVRRQVTVTVGGLRGDSAFPSDDDNRFSFPVKTTLSSLSYPALLARLEQVLQDELEFSVKPIVLRTSGVRFVTTLGERPELVQASEDTIGSRRIAYRVDVEPVSPGKMTEYTVTTLIEFRRRIERTWRPETNERLHRAAADRLRMRVASRDVKP